MRILLLIIYLAVTVAVIVNLDLWQHQSVLMGFSVPHAVEIIETALVIVGIILIWRFLPWYHDATHKKEKIIRTFAVITAGLVTMFNVLMILVIYTFSHME